MRFTKLTYALFASFLVSLASVSVAGWLAADWVDELFTSLGVPLYREAIILAILIVDFILIIIYGEAFYMLAKKKDPYLRKYGD